MSAEAVIRCAGCGDCGAWPIAGVCRLPGRAEPIHYPLCEDCGRILFIGRDGEADALIERIWLRMVPAEGWA